MNQKGFAIPLIILIVSILAIGGYVAYEKINNDVQPITPSLTIISPNGGEEYEVGETVTIEWESVLLPETYLMSGNVEMCDAIVENECINARYYDIQNSQGYYGFNNSGSIEWKIPSDVDTDKKFRVVIGTADRQEYLLSDFSDYYFTITTSTTTPDTSDWKTYKNNKTGFEFNYPANWQIEENSNISVRTLNPDKQGKPDTDQPSEAIGFGFVETACSALDWKIGFGLVFYKTSCISNNPTIHSDMLAFSDDAKKIEDQIFSTFKFTPPTTVIDTSNWKTYRNEKYGFEVEYPLDFFIDLYNNQILINALSPNDPKRASSVGLTSVVDITIETSGDIEKSINDLEESAKEIDKLEGWRYSDFSKNEIVLNNEEAVAVSIRGQYAGERHFIVFLEKNNFLYKISYVDHVTYQKIFEKILSTFKFTK